MSKENEMPYLNVRTTKGMLNDEQKQRLLSRLADVVVEVEGGGDPEFRKAVWIQLEEEEPAHWHVGGMQLTPEFVAGLVRRRDSRGK